MLLAVLAVKTQAQLVGSLAAERARLAEIVGDSALDAAARDSSLGLLVGRARRVSVLDRVPLFVVGPVVRVTWNSAIPYSLNDGALWAGRGRNASLTSGLAFEAPYHAVRFRVVVAPTLAYTENLPFQVIPSTVPNRSAYANPFHGPGASLDVPLRFGDRYLFNIYPGASSASVAWRGVQGGVTSEDEWWGPGIRNALVMSNNAPGVPRLFVRTAAPIRTRAGSLEAELISGTLTQSLFFSAIAPTYRTLSGIRVQLHPAFDSTLTFGFERVVYAAVRNTDSPFGQTLEHSFDALLRWNGLSGDTLRQKSDQIGALYARWIFPQSGLEVYGEWARMALPQSWTELLVAAHYTGGWSFGFQWAPRQREHSYLRMQSEFSYLEQSRVFLDRPTPDFYSGIASPQGYTERGQVIGAAIGPGASSQWLALDWIAPRWQAGAFVNRIRWDNDALYRQQATYFAHDVSLLGGLRAAWRAPMTDLSLELSTADRFNYLFQNSLGHPEPRATVDVHNVTLALIATPR